MISCSWTSWYFITKSVYGSYIARLTFHDSIILWQKLCEDGIFLFIFLSIFLFILCTSIKATANSKLWEHNELVKLLTLMASLIESIRMRLLSSFVWQTAVLSTSCWACWKQAYSSYTSFPCALGNLIDCREGLVSILKDRESTQ